MTLIALVLSMSTLAHAGARVDVLRFENGPRAFSVAVAPGPRNAKLPLIDPRVPESCQTVRGYGFGLSESTVINYLRLKDDKRKVVLEKLFSKQGANLSYVILPLSSSDFSEASRGDFSVCDCEPGQTIEPGGVCFNPARLKDSIEFLKDAKKVNPALRVALKPWTSPPYMKKPESLQGLTGPYKGGEFDPKWSESLGLCLAKSAEWVKSQGVPVQSVATQNEPGLALPYPSVFLDNESHARILDQIHASLKDSSPEIQLILRADNFNSAYDAKDTLSKMKTRPKRMTFFGHCYSNDAETSNVLKPEGKELFCESADEFEYAMGECSGSNQPNDGDFGWWMSNRVMLDSEMGAGAIIAWNGMLDEKYGPQNFGCDKCRGLLTADFTNPGRPRITENPELKAISTISRHVQVGAKRLMLKLPNGSPRAVFFRNPDGSNVGVLWNDGAARKVQLLVEGGRHLTISLPAQSAGTVVWK